MTTSSEEDAYLLLSLGNKERYANSTSSVSNDSRSYSDEFSPFAGGSSGRSTSSGASLYNTYTTYIHVDEGPVSTLKGGDGSLYSPYTWRLPTGPLSKRPKDTHFPYGEDDLQKYRAALAAIRLPDCDIEYIRQIIENAKKPDLEFFWCKYVVNNSKKIINLLSNGSEYE